MAIATGLSQVVEKEIYSPCCFRPIQPMGRDIGFLPGTMEEKMSPWVAPIRDNLEYLMANDKATWRVTWIGERSR